MGASRFLTDFDLHLLMESTHYRAWEKMGAHVVEIDGVQGTNFAVWAPNAARVCVIGDFNGWRDGADELASRGDSGIWEGFVPGVGRGNLYKYAIHSRHDGYRVEKADPFGFAAEIRPQTASRVWELSGYAWGDGAWMAARGARQALDAPMSIYEVHL
ncbi:MAG: 1,4-alpha-glucan branching enzyme, partial [Candidatus Eisenbacteria bacterium]